MFIQSHRGAGNLGPENTLESFRQAWELGTAPEADVRTTSDGVLVAFHDSNFRRTPSGIPEAWRDLGIEALTWDEVSQIDAGAYLGEEFRGQRIPRIDAVLDEVAARESRLLCLDIKHAPLPQLAKLCGDKGVASRCIVASTDYEVMREWVALAPESETLLWMGGTEEYLKTRLEAVRAVGFAGICQLQIHVRQAAPGSPDPFSPRPEFLRLVAAELLEKGVLSQAFPMGDLGKSPEIYQALIELGIRSFSTDYPLMALIATADNP